MLELGILGFLLAGLGLFVMLILGLLGLIFHLIILPIKIGVFLLKGVLGLTFGLIGFVFLLPVIGLALPLLLLPLILPLAVIGLIIHLVKRTKVASA